MAIEQTPLFRFLGWNTQGDLGGWTFYTDKRGQLIIFAAAPPLTPPTPAQRQKREWFRVTGLIWQTLAKQQRDLWERASKRAHLSITGYNLFTAWMIRGSQTTIGTVERQAHLTLEKPKPYNGLNL